MCNITNNDQNIEYNKIQNKVVSQAQNDQPNPIIDVLREVTIETPRFYEFLGKLFNQDIQTIKEIINSKIPEKERKIIYEFLFKMYLNGEKLSLDQLRNIIKNESKNQIAIDLPLLMSQDKETYKEIINHCLNVINSALLNETETVKKKNIIEKPNNESEQVDKKAEPFKQAVTNLTNNIKESPNTAMNALNSSSQLMCHGVVLTSSTAMGRKVDVDKINQEEKKFIQGFTYHRFSKTQKALSKKINECLKLKQEKNQLISKSKEQLTKEENERLSGIEKKIMDTEQEIRSLSEVMKRYHENFIQKFGEDFLIEMLNFDGNDKSEKDYSELYDEINACTNANSIGEKTDETIKTDTIIGENLVFNKEGKLESTKIKISDDDQPIISKVISSDLAKSHCKKLSDLAETEIKRWKKTSNAKSNEIENHGDEVLSSEMKSTIKNNLSNNLSNNYQEQETSGLILDNETNTERKSDINEVTVGHENKMTQYISILQKNVMALANCSGSLSNLLVNKKNTSVIKHPSIENIPNNEGKRSIDAVTITTSMLKDFSLDDNDDSYCDNTGLENVTLGKEEKIIVDAERKPCFCNTEPGNAMFFHGSLVVPSQKEDPTKIISCLTKMNNENEKFFTKPNQIENDVNMNIKSEKNKNNDGCIFSISSDNHQGMSEKVSNTNSLFESYGSEGNNENNETENDDKILRLNKYSCASEFNDGCLFMGSENEYTSNISQMNNGNNGNTNNTINNGSNNSQTIGNINNANVNNNNKFINSEESKNNPNEYIIPHTSKNALDENNIIDLSKLNRTQLINLFNRISVMLKNDTKNDKNYYSSSVNQNNQGASNSPSNLSSISQKQTFNGEKNNHIQTDKQIQSSAMDLVLPGIRKALLLSNTDTYYHKTVIQINVTKETFKLFSNTIFNKEFEKNIVYTIFGPKLITDPTLHSPIPPTCEIPYDVNDPFAALNVFFSECRMKYAVQYRKKNHITSHRREWLEFYCHRSGNSTTDPNSGNSKQLKPCGCNHKIQVYRALNADETPVAPYIWFVTTSSTPHQYHIPGTIDDVVHLSLADHIEEHIASILNKQKKSSFQVASEICKENLLYLEQVIRGNIYSLFISNVRTSEGSVLIKTTYAAARALAAQCGAFEVKEPEGNDNGVYELYCNASPLDIQHCETLIGKIISILKVHGAFMPTQKTITNIRNRIKKLSEAPTEQVNTNTDLSPQIKKGFNNNNDHPINETPNDYINTNNQQNNTQLIYKKPIIK